MKKALTSFLLPLVILLLLVFIFAVQPRPPVFLWQDIYFTIPGKDHLDESTNGGHSEYAQMKGELLGEITVEESHYSLPSANQASRNIAAGSKVYLIDLEKAKQYDFINTCGLLVETASGSVFFAYPYSPDSNDPEIGQRVYETFYPEYLQNEALPATPPQELDGNWTLLDAAAENQITFHVVDTDGNPVAGLYLEIFEHYLLPPDEKRPDVGVEPLPTADGAPRLTDQNGDYVWPSYGASAYRVVLSTVRAAERMPNDPCADHITPDLSGYSGHYRVEYVFDSTATIL